MDEPSGAGPARPAGEPPVGPGGEPRRGEAPSGETGEGRPADGGLAAAVAFLTLGLRMAVSFVVCGGLGYLVDDRLGTSPVFVLVGVLLGLVAAVGQAVVTVRRYL